METNLRHALTHVLWIGGATDSGKTTIARCLGEQYGLQVYHYDQHDQPQVQHLAQSNPIYQEFLSGSLEENWVNPSPQELVERTLHTIQDRFPLAVEDLLALPQEPHILVEGFGLTPEFVHPLLTSQNQAIWLIPSPRFKLNSMLQRDKPSFRKHVSDPQKAYGNLYRRDMQLTKIIKGQAQKRGLPTIEVNPSISLEQMVTWISQHFEL
ncbi:MAG: hypothetical protein JXB38_18065 [Anaerolineales bacterium]|nr:hypothetical protein [Anaerolineales bacterium]